MDGHMNTIDNVYMYDCMYYIYMYIFNSSRYRFKNSVKFKIYDSIFIFE